MTTSRCAKPSFLRRFLAQMSVCLDGPRDTCKRKECSISNNNTMNELLMPQVMQRLDWMIDRGHVPTACYTIVSRDGAAGQCLHGGFAYGWGQQYQWRDGKPRTEQVNIGWVLRDVSTAAGDGGARACSSLACCCCIDCLPAPAWLPARVAGCPCSTRLVCVCVCRPHDTAWLAQEPAAAATAEDNRLRASAGQAHAGEGRNRNHVHRDDDTRRTELEEPKQRATVCEHKGRAEHSRSAGRSSKPVVKLPGTGDTLSPHAKPPRGSSCKPSRECILLTCRRCISGAIAQGARRDGRTGASAQQQQQQQQQQRRLHRVRAEQRCANATASRCCLNRTRRHTLPYARALLIENETRQKSRRWLSSYELRSRSDSLASAILCHCHRRLWLQLRLRLLLVRKFEDELASCPTALHLRESSMKLPRASI